MTKDSWIKKVSFILSILILFVAVVQVGLNTFWPDPDYPETPCLKIPAEERLNEECLSEDQAARDAYDQERKSQHNNKFIVGTIISLIVVLLVLFVKFQESIIYGLFSGAVINMLFTLNYVENRNFIGFISLLVLFVLVIFFVQRMSKK